MSIQNFHNTLYTNIEIRFSNNPTNKSKMWYWGDKMDKKILYFHVYIYIYIYIYVCRPACDVIMFRYNFDRWNFLYVITY